MLFDPSSKTLPEASVRGLLPVALLCDDEILSALNDGCFRWPAINHDGLVELLLFPTPVAECVGGVPADALEPLRAFLLA